MPAFLLTTPPESVSAATARPTSPAVEVETTVNDIYRRYSASHGSCAFHPDGTCSVPKSAKSAKSATPFPKTAQKDVEHGECDDIELDSTLLPRFDEAIYDHLPPLLTDILKHAYSCTDRDILLISSLTLLSSVTPASKARWANTITHLPFTRS